MCGSIHIMQQLAVERSPCIASFLNDLVMIYPSLKHPSLKCRSKGIVWNTQTIGPSIL